MPTFKYVPGGSRDKGTPTELAQQALVDAARGDHRLARRRLARAARTEDPDALFHVGQTYRIGLRDPATAMGCYQRAADLGSTRAMGQLGTLHADQHDWTQAEYWLRRALTEGEDRDSAVPYIHVLMQLDRGAEAREWAQRATDAGDGLAAAMLRLLDHEAAPAQPAADDQPQVRPAMQLAELPIMGVLAVLFDQYRSTRDATLLEVALAKGREYLDGLVAPPHPSMEFCDLWRRLLRTAFGDSGSRDELFPDLIRADRIRLAAADPHDPDYPLYLADLAHTLLASTDGAGGRVHEEAVDLLRRSLAQMPASHARRRDSQLLLAAALPRALFTRAADAGGRGDLSGARARLAEMDEAIEQALREFPDQPELTDDLTGLRLVGQASATMIGQVLLRTPGRASDGDDGVWSGARTRVGAAAWHLSVGELDRAVSTVEPVTSAVESATPAVPDWLAAHAHWLHAVILAHTADPAAAGGHARAGLRYAQPLLAAGTAPAEPPEPAEPAKPPEPAEPAKPPEPAEPAKPPELAEPAVAAELVVAAAWMVVDLAVTPSAEIPLDERSAVLDQAAGVCAAQPGRPARHARAALLQHHAALLLDSLREHADPADHPRYQAIPPMLDEVLTSYGERLDDTDPDSRVWLVSAQILASRAAAVAPASRARAVELLSQAWQGIETLTWQGEAFRQPARQLAEVLAGLAPEAVRRAQAAGQWPA